jgi:hypothetical protein
VQGVCAAVAWCVAGKITVIIYKQIYNLLCTLITL